MLQPLGRRVPRFLNLLTVCGAVSILIGFVPSKLSGQSRVNTKEALTHVTKRVDPVYPPEAAAAKAGGTVYADVVIRANGTVEAVDIVSGAEILRPNVLAALRQWTFTPFLENGKPARVITLLEVPFPDPIRDEERRIYEAFRSAEFECRRAMESSPQDSIARCQELERLARPLPVERQLERSNALSSLGLAFFTNRRFAEALTSFEEALAIRQRVAGMSDEGTASIFELVGLSHFALQDFPKADVAMAASIRSYEMAIEALPNFKSSYTPRLQATLRRLADMKASRGDAAAADALRSRANALSLPDTQPAAPEQVRTIAGIQYIGPAGSFLTELDVQKIRGLVPKDSPPIWLIVGQPVGQYGELTWDIQLHLGPDFKSENLRMGQLVTLSTKLSSADAFDGSKTWVQRMRTEMYGQELQAGSDPNAVESRLDRRFPFEVVSLVDNPKFTAEEILRILAFIRERAVKTISPTDRPRVSTDIQAWPIQSISRWSNNEVQLWLRNPSGRGGQNIRMRMAAEGLSILELQ